MARQVVHSDLHVNGQLTATTITPSAGSVGNAHVSSSADIARSKLAQDTLSVFPVKMTDMRVHDAPTTILPAAAANDDLGLYGTTFATDSIYLSAGDLKAAGPTSRYARCQIVLPECYDAAETVQIRVHAGMETTAADTTCTVDIQACEIDGENGVGADLVTTAAQSMNALIYADIDFTLTATDLVAGDVLDVRIVVACNDGATGTAVTPVIGKVSLLCDIRG